MYIEASYAHHNDTARLISPVYKPTPQPHCLEFWYHMHGIGIGALRVYLQQDGLRGLPKLTLEGKMKFTHLKVYFVSNRKYLQILQKFITDRVKAVLLVLFVYLLRFAVTFGAYFTFCVNS